MILLVLFIIFITLAIITAWPGRSASPYGDYALILGLIALAILGFKVFHG